MSACAVSSGKDDDRVTHSLNITGDNVPRNHSSDQLDHTVSDPTDDINREQPVRRPRTILGLSPVHVFGLSPGSCVGDEQCHGDQTEHEHGVGEDGSGRETFHERGDEDGSDALHGGVGTRQDADVSVPDFFGETFVGEGDESSVEVFETEFVAVGWGRRKLVNHK